jgi:hypothetical protein
MRLSLRREKCGFSLGWDLAGKVAQAKSEHSHLRREGCACHGFPSRARKMVLRQTQPRVRCKRPGMRKSNGFSGLVRGLDNSIDKVQLVPYCTFWY